MGYRVGTTNYNLPQTEGTDKRDWSDTNQAFADVDAALAQAVSDASQALTLATTAQTTADGAVTTAQGAVTTANAASASATAASEAAALARTEAQSANTVAGQANTTAQAAQTTASNADTCALAAQAAVGDLTQLQTTDKSSAVAAINELANVDNDLGAYVDISTATVADKFVCPSDGYLFVESATQNSLVTVYVYGSVSSDALPLFTVAATANYASQLVQLRKGMRLATNALGTGCVARFVPFV